MVEVIGVIGGFIVGGFVVWLILKASQSKSTEIYEARIKEINNEIRSLSQELDITREKNLTLVSEVATLETTNKNLEEQQQENEKMLMERFENLANDILDKKSQKFTDQNKKNLDDLLSPLKDKIKDFEKKVEDSNKESLRWNSTLKEQIDNLKDVNQKLNKEAQNLTKALTGDSKTQGDWGELQLELILEKAGLKKGIHFTTQGGFRDEAGQLKKPDFIVKLPENRNLIIDSKVSLTAYERYATSENEQEKDVFLREHIKSVKDKIKDLSSKNYQELHSINTPDYVMMYIPVEPAFFAATQADNSLYFDALDKNIVLVTSSTLLATMRTVSYIWIQEDQSKNVLEIARQSGALYDKFVGFTEDLIGVGKAMDKAKSGYTSAMNKLSEGTGNLVKRAENIKKLGAKASKSLDPKLVERAEDFIEENINAEDHENNTGS